MPKPARPERTVDLPITRVVLFSSGVGYFEHAGQVTGDAQLRLQFKAEQIPDVLKSMVLTDHDGGRISSVTYPSQDPVERALRSFEIDLADDPSISKLLSQLRGCTVVVHGTEKIEGVVLTVETVHRIVGTAKVTEMQHMLAIVTKAGVRNVNLANIDRFVLSDPRLQEELAKALALMADSRNKQRRPVDIRFAGKGKRRVRVGYLVETAIWKTSYRLDLTGEKPTLQGWAIVDNPSDHDWSGVDLSLVSGQPISFIQDLYTPLYAKRPVVKPKLPAGVMPQLYEEGMEAMAMVAEGPEQEVLYSRAPAAGGVVRSRKAYQVSGGLPADYSSAMVSTDRGVESVATGASIGELFSFSISHPVDLARRSSAMLPIYSGPVGGQKISIFNERVKPTRPLNGAILINDTKLKLLGGPITVFDGGVYAGDAQIEHLPPDDKRYLSYAVDLEMTIDPSVDTKHAAVAWKIAKGALHIRSSYTHEKTYAIKNKAKADRTLIVEHPFDSSRTLTQPAEYEEKTPDRYRFKVPVKAGATVVFKVVEKQTTSQGMSIIQSTVNDLAHYQTSKQTDPKLAAALEKAMKLRGRLAELEEEQSRIEKSSKDIAKDQERINANIKSAGAESPLGRRYVAKLNEQEDRLEAMQKQLAEIEQKVKKARQELADYLEGLTIEV